MEPAPCEGFLLLSISTFLCFESLKFFIFQVTTVSLSLVFAFVVCLIIVENCPFESAGLASFWTFYESNNKKNRFKIYKEISISCLHKQIRYLKHVLLVGICNNFIYMYCTESKYC